MAQAIELLTGKEVKSKFDKDKKQTTWLIRSLTSFEFIECTCRGYVDHAMIIHKGLTGWEDFKDSKNKPIEFSEDNISKIPPNILVDLSLEIQLISSLTEKERKNL